MYYQAKIESIEDYERITGDKWPFGQEEWNTLDEFMTDKKLFVFRRSDGSTSIDSWKVFNSLNELVEHIKTNTCIHNFCKRHMFTNVPEFSDEDYYDFVYEFIDYARAEIGITILPMGNNRFMKSSLIF